MSNESQKIELNKEGNRWMFNKSGNKRGLHPNSRKNLTRKGCGRPPRELCLTDIAREKLNEPCPYDSKGRPWKIYLVERWLGQSVENAQYFRELMDRLEGKVVQPIGGNGEPVTLRVIYERTWNKDTGAASRTG